ncbi:MAG: hypothetical protein ABI386_04570 [Rhodanobacter sp.]
MYIATQPNMLWRFNFDISDAHGNKVGAINWPDIAVATNSRAKDMYPENWTRHVDIVSAGHPFKVAFEYLNRAWNMDVRFTLLDGDHMIASVDCCHAKTLFQRATMQVTAPFNGQIVHRRGLFAVRYDVLGDGRQIGRVYEKPGLVWRRKIFIDIDDSVDIPVQFFLFFLVCNYAFH